MICCPLQWTLIRLIKKIVFLNLPDDKGGGHIAHLGALEERDNGQKVAANADDHDQKGHDRRKGQQRLREAANDMRTNYENYEFVGIWIVEAIAALILEVIVIDL